MSYSTFSPTHCRKVLESYRGSCYALLSDLVTPGQSHTSGVYNSALLVFRTISRAALELIQEPQKTIPSDVYRMLVVGGTAGFGITYIVSGTKTIVEGAQLLKEMPQTALKKVLHGTASIAFGIGGLFLASTYMLEQKHCVIPPEYRDCKIY